VLDAGWSLLKGNLMHRELGRKSANFKFREAGAAKSTRPSFMVEWLSARTFLPMNEAALLFHNSSDAGWKIKLRSIHEQEPSR
jgi:hypothetical protein